MKLRNALLAATVLAAPLFATAAKAEVIDGLYVGLGAGYNLLQSSRLSGFTAAANPGLGNHIRYGGGFIGVGSIGYGLGNGLRFEIQGDYHQDKVRGVSHYLTGVNAGGDSLNYGGFANVLYDIDLGQFGIDSPVTPYVGAGVGYIQTKLSNTRIYNSFPLATTFRDQTNNSQGSFAYQGIVGAAFPIDAIPGLSLTAEYRFIGTSDSKTYSFQYFSGAFVGNQKLRLSENYAHAGLFGIRYAFNAAPPPPPPAPVAPAPVVTPARTYLVFFDWDRADLTDRARQIIAEAASASTRVQYTRIEVAGHADLSGTPAYNQRLSLRRAQNVAAELVRLGVPRTAIDIQAFGDTRPLVPTARGVREPQNRRVEIVLR